MTHSDFVFSASGYILTYLLTYLLTYIVLNGDNHVTVVAVTVT